MKDYERLGFALHQLLEMGYELSIEVKAITRVPTMPQHWLAGIPITVGKLTLKNDRVKGTKLEFHGDDSGANFDTIVKILEGIKKDPSKVTLGF